MCCYIEREREREEKLKRSCVNRQLKSFNKSFWFFSDYAAVLVSGLRLLCVTLLILYACSFLSLSIYISI